MFAIKGTLCIIFALTVFISAEKDHTHPHDWDILIFTQHWPATVCFEWKGKEPSNTCAFPSQRDAWTVHGIWPTKLGTIGPGFCNKSMKFDISQIEPIEQQLEQYWINIEKETPLDSLWEHEWSKHGTCASVLPTLDGEMKYFAQGLRWLQLYSMSDILAKAGITPSNDTHFPQDIYDSIKQKIGKNPSMHCHTDEKTGKSYMFEIRICFDKQLDLVDCDGIKVAEHLGNDKLLHCNLTQPVYYTSIVPQVAETSCWEWPLVEMYKMIMWLHWFTL